MAERNNSQNFSSEEAALTLRNAKEFINSRLINREEVVDQAFYALLTGEHLLLQSRTGAGKTLLADQIFTMFEGANIFKVQASKEQQPDTYFGGLDIEKLKTGKIHHNTEHSLVECEFGFIDEIFDANDFTLRALLSLLNERALIRGVQNQQAKTHTVIAATNYLRVTEVTEAILDRFLYKAIILPDKIPFTQYQIAQRYLKFSGNAAKPSKKIPFSYLYQLHRIVTGADENISITIAPDVLYFTNLVIRHFEYSRNRLMKERAKAHSGYADDDFYISPRTQAKALDLLRAIAFLDGRSAVTLEDIPKLHFIFATLGVEEERNLFAKSYSTMSNTLAVSNGFDQIRILLSFGTIIEQIREDKSLIGKPLTELQATPIRRTFFEWIKQTFSGADESVENNKKLLVGFLHEFIPVCEEVRELKQHMENDLQKMLKGL